MADPGQKTEGVNLRKTYTFYLQDGCDDARFVPAICASDVEALAHARALLAAHTDCEAVEVFIGEVRLFDVAQSSS